MVHQRFTAPVLRNVTEEPMLDLVPFARSRRQVADAQSQSRPFGQLLQRNLPQPTAAAVAPTAIGCDQQLTRTGITLRTHLSPPSPDRLGGELCCVVIDADAHPSLVVSQIVDAVRDCLAECRVLKVVNPHLFGFTFGSPFAPAVLEIPDQFLL